MLTQKQLVAYAKDNGVSTKMVQVVHKGYTISLWRARKEGVTVFHFDLEESIRQCLLRFEEFGPGTLFQRLGDKISDFLGF